MTLLWWYWIAFGMALMLAELIVPSFTIIWFGLGGLVVGCLLWLLPEMSLALQLFIWAVASSIFTLLWFKVINPKMVDRSHSGMAREALIGQSGMVVVAPTDASRGRVRFSAPLLGADEWEFISTEELKAGDRVTVTDHSGNTLVVKPSA
ncbi:MAG: hypothetical protein C0609_02225 [Deltaproteobacteria bacterium]|nr:MAG: hypothetical protein C0609_02225 [Deltaproteobacteria bacterium]